MARKLLRKGQCPLEIHHRAFAHAREVGSREGLVADEETSAPGPVELRHGEARSVHGDALAELEVGEAGLKPEVHRARSRGIRVDANLGDGGGSFYDSC